MLEYYSQFWGFYIYIVSRFLGNFTNFFQLLQFIPAF